MANNFNVVKVQAVTSFGHVHPEVHPNAYIGEVVSRLQVDPDWLYVPFAYGDTFIKISQIGRGSNDFSNQGGGLCSN